MKYSGKIQSGDGMGEKIGFPTYNIEISGTHPKKGVYAVQGKCNGKAFTGVLHSGPRPTFGKMEHRVEIHVFHHTKFPKHPYSVEFKIIGEKIRSVQKFSSLEQLKEQIKKDISVAQKVLLGK